MVNCNKRQKENFKGKISYRCIHPEASTKGQTVPEAVCLACPLVRAKPKPCKEIKKEKTRKAWRPDDQLPVLNLQPGYPQCPFRYGKGEANTQICSITNLGVTPEICGRCDEETRERVASLGTKIVNYFGAIRRWVASGRPVRSQEEIESLFETHCNASPTPCERYDPEKHACKNCGCTVSTDSEPLGNKLAMATEHCPLGRF